MEEEDGILTYMGGHETRSERRGERLQLIREGGTCAIGMSWA